MNAPLAFVKMPTIAPDAQGTLYAMLQTTLFSLVPKGVCAHVFEAAKKASIFTFLMKMDAQKGA